MTIAESIKAMTDDELAEMIHTIRFCYSTKTMFPCRECPLKGLRECSKEAIVE